MDLTDFITEQNYDIVLLTETWLTNDVKNGELFLSGFNVLRADRPTSSLTSKHGGVLIAIKNNIMHCKIDLNELPSTITSSTVIVKLETNNPIYIVVMYNPPSGSEYQIPQLDLETLFDYLKKTLEKMLFSRAISTCP